MNNIILAGTIVDKPKFSHVSFDVSYHSFFISVERKSGTCDVIRCIIPSTYAYRLEDMKYVKVYGEIRSYNAANGDSRKLNVYVHVQAFKRLETEENENFVSAVGYICSISKVKTAAHGRHHLDIMIACPRKIYYRNDYIPALAWGTHAFVASELEKSTEVAFCGRLQSREYVKELTDGTEEKRTVYEVSIKEFSVCEKGEEKNELKCSSDSIR